MTYRLTLIVFASLLLVINAAAQQVIPFNIGSNDPKAKFRFPGWSVMAKFDGTVEVSTVGSKRLLKIKMTGGELLAPKEQKTVISVTPFVAKRKDKLFDLAAVATPLQLKQPLQPGVPHRLGPHEFVIETNAAEDISKYWLAFVIEIACESKCTAYSHSPSNIFAGL